MIKHAKKVLIIEDDGWLADEYARVLGRAGYAVEQAGNALQAMDAVDRSAPSVLLLDLFMPGPNGLVLLHELRSHADLMNIPVVMITNAAADINIADLAPYGVGRILDKSTMQPGDVLAAVKGVCDEQ